MDLLSKENFQPLSHGDNSKKTPKAKRIKIYSEDSPQREDSSLEIEKLKSKLREVEERSDEWKKKYKSQADTFRENFDQYKQVKLENEKLRNEIQELQSIESNRPKQVIENDSGKYGRTLLENKELRSQIEKMDNLTNEMSDFDKQQVKWNEKLWDVCQKIHQINERSKKEILQLKNQVTQNDKVRSEQDSIVTELREKENSYLQQLETYHDKLKVLTFHNENFGQQNKNLMIKSENLASIVQELEEKVKLLQNEVASNSDQVQQKSSDLEDAKREIQQLNDHISTLDEKSLENSRITEMLQMELGSVRSKTVGLQNDLDGKKVEINKLKSLLEESLAHQNELKGQVDTLTHENSMEKEKTLRSESNLSDVFKRYQDLIEFKDEERDQDEIYVQELEQALEHHKSKTLQLGQDLLEQGESHIRTLFELNDNLSKTRATMRISELQNMEMKSLLESNQQLIVDLETSSQEGNTKFDQLTNNIIEFNQSLGILSDFECPFASTIQYFGGLKQSQKEVVALLGEMQKTLQDVELVHGDKDLQYECKLKDVTDQLNSLKSSFRDTMEKEYAKSQNLTIQVEEVKSQLIESTNYQSVLENKLKDLLTNFESLNERYLACLHSMKKARHEITPNGHTMIDTQKLEQIVKRSNHLEKMIKNLNIEMVILQKEKTEMALRLDIIALEKYNDSDHDDLLMKWHSQQNKMFGLEQRNVMYSEDITLLKKEKLILQDKLDKYVKLSGEKLQKLTDLFENSQMNVDWMNHVLDKVRTLVGRVTDPLGNEIKDLLQ